MTWMVSMKQRPPTERQLKLIEDMEFVLEKYGIEFTGQTMDEASEFISFHMDKYREELDYIMMLTFEEIQYGD